MGVKMPGTDTDIAWVAGGPMAWNMYYKDWTQSAVSPDMPTQPRPPTEKEALAGATKQKQIQTKYSAPENQALGLTTTKKNNSLGKALKKIYIGEV